MKSHGCGAYLDPVHDDLPVVSGQHPEVDGGGGDARQHVLRYPGADHGGGRGGALHGVGDRVGGQRARDGRREQPEVGEDEPVREGGDGRREEEEGVALRGGDAGRLRVGLQRRECSV